MLESIAPTLRCSCDLYAMILRDGEWVQLITINIPEYHPTGTFVPQRERDLLELKLALVSKSHGKRFGFILQVRRSVLVKSYSPISTAGVYHSIQSPMSRTSHSRSEPGWYLQHQYDTGNPDVLQWRSIVSTPPEVGRVASSQCHEATQAKNFCCGMA